jgi:hypothetical protein
LDVQIRDEVGLSPIVLDEARRTASEVFERVGVTLVWLTPAEARRQEDGVPGDARRAFLRSLFTVRIIPVAGRAMGSSALNTRQAVARWRAIERQAAAAGVSAGAVLGHVLAHELGHLLLNRSSHSAEGLMAPSLNTTRAAQGRLGFTQAEAEVIRSRVAKSP